MSKNPAVYSSRRPLATFAESSEQAIEVQRLYLEIADKFVQERGESDEQMSQLNGRGDLWEELWGEFKHSPLVGHGYFLTTRTGWMYCWPAIISATLPIKSANWDRTEAATISANAKSCMSKTTIAPAGLPKSLA